MGEEENLTIYYCRACDDLVEINGKDEEPECPNCECSNRLQFIS